MNNTKGASKILIVLVVLVLIIAGALIYYFYVSGQNATDSTANDDQGHDRDLVTVASVGDITGIYPEGEDESLTFNVNRHIFDPLVSLNKSMQIKPSLALSWTTNPDNLTWRFKLKPNITFHDGTTFGAEDVKFSIETALKDEWPSSAYLSSIDTVTVIDPTTVDIKTKETTPVLLNNLANFLIVSKNYQKGGNPNGTGPYKYVSWSKETMTVTLIANENYFAGAPKVKKVVFQAIEAEKDRVTALAQKQADVAMLGVEEKPANEITAANVDLTLKSALSASVSTILFIVNKDTSPFKDLKVRQAFYHAINPDKLTENILAGGESASQIVPKMIFGYNEDVKRLAYDPVLAKRLLTEAGYPDGLKIEVADVKGMAEAMDQEMVTQLNAAGFQATLNLLSKEDMGANLFETRTLPVVRLSWSEDTGEASNALNALFHSPDKEGIYGSMNQGYSNASLDQLCTDASKIIDQAKRKQILQQAIKLVSDDVAYVPLYVPKIVFGVSKTLRWEPRPDRMVYAFEMAGL